MARTSVRSGFTLMELMIVIAVVIALSAIGFPAWNYIRKTANINATRGLVQAVALSITSYGTKYWEVNWDDDGDDPDGDGKTAAGGNATPMKKKMCRLWDMNIKPGDAFNATNPTPGDGILDGKPNINNTGANPIPEVTDQYDGQFWNQLVKSGYTGFIAMTLPAISKRNIDKTGRVVDAWGKPLHIAYGVDVYGPAGFGIWSEGPDKKDGVVSPDDFTLDNITSWKSAND